MSIVVNPGTGPVHGTREQARANLDVFAADVAARHGYDLAGSTITYVRVEPVTTVVEPYEMPLPDGRTVRSERHEWTEDPESDGRFTYGLAFTDGPDLEVEMPGLPVEQVRWTGADDQNPWDYPRLYVGGSSWLWEYGVSVFSRADEDED